MTKRYENPQIILAVVDERLRSALSNSLLRWGYEVFDVDTTKRLARLMLRKDPAVAILDQKIFPTNGFDLVKKIKKLRPLVQVIMLTSFDAFDNVHKNEISDMFESVAKPCTLDEVKASVERAVQKRFYSEHPPQKNISLKRRIRTWLDCYMKNITLIANGLKTNEQGRSCKLQHRGRH